MSPHRPETPSVLQAEEPPKQRAGAFAAREQKEEKGSEPGNQSPSCFISGSCDRKCKVFTGDLSPRWMAAGETQRKNNGGKSELLSNIYNL